MYYHVNNRSGLKSPLIADDVFEIIMEVTYSNSCIFLNLAEGLLLAVHLMAWLALRACDITRSTI
jgi:hypothetical protein